MKWLAAFFLLAHLLLPPAPGAFAQAEGVTITDLGVEPEFGKQIIFQVQVQPVSKVQEITIFITPEGQSTVWQKMDLQLADARGKISQPVDVRQLQLYPFSKVHYRYEVLLTDGSKIGGEPETFEYDDNRFTWQSLESGIFEIHWYGDDTALGQMIANVAAEGLESAQELLDITPPAPLRIYAYTSSRDLQSALQLTNQPWIAGHTTPELGMVLISVPSGVEKKLELERQIPHEIMHILQYQITGENYARQPLWLVEGMASLVEAYPNPEYRTVLQSAASSNNMIPIRSLCAAFPRETGGAFQAYAQSESFVRFLFTRYGASGLRDLMEQYQDGLGCEEGFAASFDIPLSQAEYRWQQETLGINMGRLVLNNLSPYLLVGLLVLVSTGLAFFPYRPKHANQA